jgi:nitroreductase
MNIKRILPNPLRTFLRDSKQFLLLFKAYMYDFWKYMFYSEFSFANKENNLRSKIILDYHVIEKGLTMPNMRLGFGRDRLLVLSENCKTFVERYNSNDIQVNHAIGVIKEYIENHKNFTFDEELLSSINDLQKNSASVKSCKQVETNIDEYFEHTASKFSEFSSSRRSIRNFSSEPIDPKKMKDALLLAQNTPSACNRQSVRTYTYTNSDKIQEILKVQGGNRGFGHLVDKLIVITAEISVFSNVGERNSAFVDGGMYAMNLLYALHSNKIGACTLNTANTPAKDKILAELCGTSKSEVFICMIACGIPAKSFKIPISKRNLFERTNLIIQD